MHTPRAPLPLIVKMIAGLVIVLIVMLMMGLWKSHLTEGVDYATVGTAIVISMVSIVISGYVFLKVILDGY